CRTFRRGRGAGRVRPGAAGGGAWRPHGTDLRPPALLLGAPGTGALPGGGELPAARRLPARVRVFAAPRAAGRRSRPHGRVINTPHPYRRRNAAERMPRLRNRPGEPEIGPGRSIAS